MYTSGNFPRTGQNLPIQTTTITTQEKQKSFTLSGIAKKVGSLFQGTLSKAETNYRFIAAGADKVVWKPPKKTGASNEAEKKAYYTPNTAFGRSREKVLKAEFSQVQEIADATGGDNEFLAVDWKEMKGADRIKGQFTLEVGRAKTDFEKAINPPKLELNMKTGKLEQKNPPTTFEARVGFGRDMLSGLNALHGKGYVHGDLKPENCLIFEKKVEGQPPTRCLKIGDFGRAKSVDGDQGVKYEGNTRFAPPEGVASKKGEVYSAALMMMRSFEESLPGFDGKSLVKVDSKDQDSTPHGVRRGLDAFVLEHKAFPACENKGSFVGRIKNAFRRNTELGKASPSKRQKQAELMQEYADKLCNELVKKRQLEETKAAQLKELLNKMLDPDPATRLTMQRAIAEYNEIFPPTQDQK